MVRDVLQIAVALPSSSQGLTTWGTCTEMASRFTEPVLLALAVLAVRSRIKRWHPSSGA
ncbi:hypothetical protein ACH49O_30245 [Streptomyces coeruleorubidus]|uniref:hypothetical protein n=1 Tax=Streptomyces coeruleorubidus TaxID=116188 RepID=UPI0033EBCBE3